MLEKQIIVDYFNLSYRIAFVVVDAQYGSFTTKFTDLIDPLPQSLRVHLNKNVYTKYLTGVDDTLLEEYILEVLRVAFSQADAEKTWVRGLIRDFMYGVKGVGMIQFNLSVCYPADGGGSGLGFGVRQN